MPPEGDSVQRNAARAVGFAYLLTSALAYLAEFQVRATLFDYQSPAHTVANIISSQRLFRLGLAADLLVEPMCFVPIGTFELIVGFWLLVFGLPHVRGAGTQTARA